MDDDMWQTEYSRSYKWTAPAPLEKKEDAASENSAIVTIDEQVQTEIEEISLDIPEINASEPESKPSENIKEMAKDEKVSEIPAAIKQATKEYTIPKSKTIHKPAEMLSYGWANNKPIIPKHYMKTFNVNVPKSEVMPTTLDRQRRRREININQPEKKVTFVKKSITENGDLDAFKNYIKAQKSLDAANQRFKSEYQREFVNWGDSVSRIQKKAAGLKSDQQIDEVIEKQTLKSPKKSYSVVEKKDAITSPTSNKKDVGLSPIESTKNIKVDTCTSPTINAKKVFEFLKADDILESVGETLLPAGISEEESHAVKEKRHYPAHKADLQEQWEEMAAGMKSLSPTSPFENNNVKSTINREPIPTEHPHNGRILSYSIEPPTTWRLAQDLLNRAHERSQRLKVDMNVENL